MPIDTFVKDPESIQTVEEAKDYLHRIIAYEKERRCTAGVLVIQNMQLGLLYRIKSEEDAHEWMSRPLIDENGNRTPEFGNKFYPRSYFENKMGELS